MFAMGSKKFLYEFCIFYMMGLLSCSLVFAQMEDCSFSNSDIEGVEVGRIGGRQIYTLFTSHLFGERIGITEIIRFHEPENAVASLILFIENHRERIASEQSDTQKIIELAESGKIDWVGIEHSKTDTSYVSNRVQHYSQHRGGINWYFNSSPEWNADKTTQLLFLLHPAYIIAYASRPGIFQRVPIYPLEDETLMKESADRATNYLHWRNLIIEDPHVTRHQVSEVSSFMETSTTLNFLIPESEFEALLDTLEVPEESRIRMRMLRITQNDFLSSILRRDKATVPSILDLPGNGLLLFGTLHGPGIKQGLITACQNEIN